MQLGQFNPRGISNLSILGLFMPTPTFHVLTESLIEGSYRIGPVGHLF